MNHHQNVIDPTSKETENKDEAQTKLTIQTLATITIDSSVKPQPIVDKPQGRREKTYPKREARSCCGEGESQ